MAETESRIARLLRRMIPPRSETSAVGVTVILAVLVGLLAGILALGLNWCVGFLNRHLFLGIGRPVGSLPEPWRYVLVCLPAVVFLVVAYAIRWTAPETQGTGIGRVMSSIGRGGGFIRRRVIMLKPLFTALCIGAGAPLGMEGPVVQTGAAVGSLVGEHSKMGVGNTRVLVAAGAAAGLAAKYGAPIGGAVFSAELILGGAGAPALLPLIVASVSAVIVRFSLLGHLSEYVIPALPTFVAADYLLFTVLGVLAGLVSIYFVKLIFAVDDLFERLFSQLWARALFGGLAVGLVGFVAPSLLGTGHGFIQSLLTEPDTSLRMLIVFVLLKPLLCSLGLASGASGGIFAPALFSGAALGAFFYGLAQTWLGLDIAPFHAYVMVGMAAVMGAVMRAPLQAILVTFELTRNYSAIPALMIACVISIKVAELFEPESAFTRRLIRLGMRMARGMDYSLLNDLTVGDVAAESYTALPANADITEIGEKVRRSENRTFPVVDGQQRFVGLVMLASLLAAAQRRRDGERMPVRDLLEPEAVSLQADQPLIEAWRTMGNYDYDCLPVCDPDEPDRIVGICEKEAIVELHDRQAFVELARKDR